MTSPCWRAEVTDDTRIFSNLAVAGSHSDLSRHVTVHLEHSAYKATLTAFQILHFHCAVSGGNSSKVHHNHAFSYQNTP